MRTLTLFLLLLFAQSAFATMGTYNYSSYTNTSGDSSNLYMTVSVSGSTNCSANPQICGAPGTVYHSGTVFAQIGSVSRTITGTPVMPAYYLSASNAITMTGVTQGAVYKT